MEIQESNLQSEVYDMATASIKGGSLNFTSNQEMRRAMADGFFRVKIPENLDMGPAQEFAETFPSKKRYNSFGLLDVVNGYFPSNLVQTVRFSLERDNWGKCHVLQKEVNGAPNYSKQIQDIGYKMQEIGMQILKNVLSIHDLPKDIWFEATGGAALDRGSYYLLFNHYNPKYSDGKDGLSAHKDWGLVTVLYATDQGLEAKIDGVWRKLFLEEGYFTINFGHSLEKLLPSINASIHRVTPQKDKTRVSIAAFISNRVGPYNPQANTQSSEGLVYSWDNIIKRLVGGETTISFFEKLSAGLYGSYSD